MWTRAEFLLFMFRGDGAGGNCHPPPKKGKGENFLTLNNFELNAEY